MRDELKFWEQADQYLDGEMSQTERVDFENILARDSDLQKRFDEHLTIREQLKQRTDRREIKLSLEQAYHVWKADKPASSRTKTSVLWKAVAVAAGLALLISIAGVWLTMNQFKQHKTKSYTILRREIDDIKRSQKDLMDDILSSEKPAVSGQQYGGTGFAISANGYLATNAHVVKGADSIYVITHDGGSLKANLVYEDKKCDLAILKIKDSTFHLPPLPFELASKSASLGEEIYTLGYPRNEIVYGKGYISAETGFEGDSGSYQLTLPVNPGNSGGPLIDEDGKILGIISGKQSATDNIAFAVKSSYLLKMLDSLPKDFPEKALKSNRLALRHLDRIDQIKKLEQYVFLVKVFN